MTARPRTSSRKRGPGRPQGAVWEETRNHILETSLVRFSTGGFGDTAVSALASDAGVASALIYYYFGSKSGLFRSVVETARMRLKERLIAPILAVVAHQASLESRLTTLVSVLAHRGSDDIGLHRLILAGDLEADIPEVLAVRETIGEDIQRLYWAVAGLHEHGPENDQEHQLVATIELLVLGIWLFGMRRQGVERLPIVVQAFKDLLTGTLFEADHEHEPGVGTETRKETPTSSEALDDDAELEERLASIALQRFASSGYGKTSLKEIATLAGVTTGAIFHHFGSKAGLYRAAGALGIQRMVDRSSYSIAIANVRGVGSERVRVKEHFQSIGATVEDLVHNHWMGLRVQVDAELYPALVQMRDEWADALEQHYHSVTEGGQPASGSGEKAPAQEPLPVLLDVLTLGTSWYTVRHGTDAVKSALLGLERLIDGEKFPPPDTPAVKGRQPAVRSLT